MPVVSLVRRRTQIDLLDRACDAGALAQVACRRGCARFQARFLSRDPEGVYLEPLSEFPAQFARPGLTLEVTFAFAGQRFSFPSETRGWTNAGATDALQIALPLRIEARAAREAARHAIPASAGWRAELEPVFANARVGELLVTNFSRAGMAGRLAGNGAAQLQRGQIFRATIKIPTQPPQALLARLVHFRPAGSVSVAGFRFCHGEDRETCQRRLEHLDSLADSVTELANPARPSLKGAAPC